MHKNTKDWTGQKTWKKKEDNTEQRKYNTCEEQIYGKLKKKKNERKKHYIYIPKT